MTILTALLQGTQLLQDEAISVPRLTAEVLLTHALHRERLLAPLLARQIALVVLQIVIARAAHRRNFYRFMLNDA